MSHELKWLIDVYLASAAHQYRGTQETVETFKRILEELKTAFGNENVDRLKWEKIVEWIHTYAAWTSANTKETNYNKIKQMFRWAEQHFGVTNPLKDVTSTDRPWNTDEKNGFSPVSDDQFHDLLHVATPRFRRILRFMRLTGCTPIETRDLRWRMIEETKIRLTKNGKTRTVPILPDLALVLDEVRAEAHEKHRDSEDNFVFTTRSGRQWSRQTLDGEFRRVKESAGLPDCSLFGVGRTSFYQKGLASGLQPEQVAKLVGVKSTAAVTRFKPRDMSQDEEQLSEMYAKIHGAAPIKSRSVTRRK